MNPPGSPGEDDVQTPPEIVTASRITASRVIPPRFSLKGRGDPPLLFKGPPKRLQLSALDQRGKLLSRFGDPAHIAENAGDTPDPRTAAIRKFETDRRTTDQLRPPSTPGLSRGGNIRSSIENRNTGADQAFNPPLAARTPFNRPWAPGTFGFGSEHSVKHDIDPEFDKLATIPMIVLQGISKQQGEAAPAMQSELSGAASGAAIVGAGSILGNFLKYGNSLLIQRSFGAGPFGLYSLGMSTVNLVISVFNLGLDDAMVRYASIYKGKKQSNLLIGLTLFCSIAAGIAGLVGAFLVLYFAPLLAAIRHSPDIIPLLLVLSPMVPIASAQAVWTGGLQGLKAFKWRVIVQRLIVPGSLLLLFIVVVIFFRDITWVAIATVVSAIIGAIANLYFYYRMVSQVGGRRAGREEYQIREWLGFALPNFLTSILDTVLESIDTILLATLVVSYVAVGQYAAAIKISSFIAVPLQTFNVMFAPTIAELYSKEEKQKLSIMFKVVTSWSISFSLPIFLIAVLFAKPLLGISGPTFVGAWPLLIALAVGNFFNAGTGSVGYMLSMTGHQKLTFINSMAAVIINVVLGIILTPMYGAMGTAIATGLAVAVVNLMRLLQVKLLLNLNPYRWDTLKPLAAGLISSLLTAGLLHLLNIDPITFRFFHLSLAIQLLLVPVFLASYVMLLVLFGVSPEDKIVLDKLGGKFQRKKKKK